MKILYFTNCFPSQGNSMSGVFIYQRVIELEKKDIIVNVVNYKLTTKRFNYLKFRFNNFIKNKKTLKSNSALNSNVAISTIFSFGNDNFPNYKFTDSPTINQIAEDLYYEYKKSGSQLIHVHFLWYAYPAYLLKKKYGIPYVITLQGSDIHESPFISEQNKENALILLNNADHLIFVSKFLLQKTKEFGFKGKNVSVISNGYVDNFFNVQQVTKSNTYTTIGFVGNIIESKGILFLPEIFHHISLEIPNVRFIIIGEGSEKDKFQKLLVEFNIVDQVTFVGKINPEKVAEHMKQMDVLLLPSYNEGFPCVLVEAQACGVRIVASENGGTVEATKHTGRIVKNGENYANRYSATILELLKTKNDIVETNNSVKDYTWSNIVNREIEVYNLILNK